MVAIKLGSSGRIGGKATLAWEAEAEAEAETATVFWPTGVGLPPSPGVAEETGRFEPVEQPNSARQKSREIAVLKVFHRRRHDSLRNS
jgi:hypothetical protein